MDRITVEQRSKIMSRIRNRDTKPELVTRSILHGLGFRYSLHRRDLPGIPDLYLKKYNAIIFVHGCFWHQHPGCKHSRIPKSNLEFWIPKLKRNRKRDLLVFRQIKNMGLNCVVIWECSISLKNRTIKNLCRIMARLRKQKLNHKFAHI